ncbi:MAG: MdtA/MuxA family multidrug efflux RND transporter periplasmic adaptor subunit [Candidatus Sulfopaludibacter sp.]|nr:MdtA/MuxA family multidrug efflux RND transporter periplasmic adaptor subunit [Candidatus Sulfopaludibacter sp.]
MTQKTPTAPEHIKPAPIREEELPHQPESTKRSSGKGWIWLLVLILAAAAAYYFYPKGAATDSGTPSDAGKSGKKKGGGLAPVVAVKATRGNIGVYIDDPGLIVPIYTELVKSRVDGQLMAIHYNEGDLIQKGQPLVDLDDRPFKVALEQAEGQLARDQALLDNANVDLARYQTLLAQNAIPEQQLATQKALVSQYEGTVKTDRGMIDSAQLNIVYSHITADITGKAGLRLVDPGNIVHAADTTGLVVITQVQPISAVFPVAEDQLPAVSKHFRTGEKLTVEAWDRDGRNKLAVGTLATMDNQIDPTTGTLKLRAIFDNKDDSLYPNQLVKNRLLVEMKHGVVLLPTAAIQLTATGKYVWMLKPDSTVTVRNITTGTAEGDQSEITSGLEAGDNVILTGVDKLNEGSKVNVASGGDGGGRGGSRAGGVPSGSAPADNTQVKKSGRKGKSGGQHQ